MPHVDSLLSLAFREGANELRLGTDRAPAMLAMGAPKRLTIPKTSADTLRHLLGELLTSEVEEALREQRKAEMAHDVVGVGTFRVSISARGDGEGGIDAIFLLKKAEAPKSAEPTAPAATELPKPPVGPASVPDGRADARALDARAVEASPMDTRPLQLATPHATQAGASPALARLLARAIALHASDLHLSRGEAPVLRVDGNLTVLADEAAVDVEAVVGGMLDARARERVEGGGSADFVLEAPAGDASRGGARRARGNVYRTANGLAAAFRVLAGEPPSLDSLAFPVPIADLAQLPNGLVIVTGPTGSGKSTTLASLAQEALRRRSILLVSLEDPIEYVLTGGPTRGRGESLVRQRQIGRDVRDFATGLRDALREDPDVILVGEMRDEASISLALTAAETGHLVLTTLHSRSAASAIERIVDVYREGRQRQVRIQLADSLRAVVAQRLVPRSRGEGRALAAEVLRVTPGVATGLREGKISSVTSAMQSGRKDAMITLERALADLVRRGEIVHEQALAVANDPESLASYLRSAP